MDVIRKHAFILWFVLLGIVSFSKPQGARNSCSLRIRKPFKSIAHERANPECTSGRVWWNYPAGKVVIDFQYELGHKSFLLCLILKPDPAGIKFYDITEGEHKHRRLPLSKKGYYTCVPDHNGSVTLLMEGPFFPITYLYMLQYRLLTHWEPAGRLSKSK